MLASEAEPAARERVVVVGAGVAGLTAAYRLADYDPLVLEAEEYVGGRTHSVAFSEQAWANLGAQWLPAESHPMAREVGAELIEETLPPPALFLNGKRVIETSLVRWFIALPFAFRARLQMLKLGVRLALAVRRLRRDGGRDLEAISLEQWIGKVHPDLQSLLTLWTAMAGARHLSDISAKVGIDVVETALGKITYHGKAQFSIVSGGTDQLAKRIAERLQRPVVTGARVTSITRHDDGVEIRYRAGGGEQVVMADDCVVATPMPQTAAVCADLPETKQEALRSVSPVRCVTAAVTASGGPWDRMYWMRCSANLPGMSVLNAAYFVPSHKRRPGEPTVLSITLGGLTADLVWDMSDAELTAAIVKQLETVFPEGRGKFEVTHIQRWDPAYLTLAPGAERLEQAREASVGHLHFCGDWIYGLGTDVAIRSGEHVAGLVRASSRRSIEAQVL